jgi:hypothetical protein
MLKTPGNGRFRAFCAALVLTLLCSAAALADRTPNISELDGARFLIKTQSTRYSLGGAREYSYRGEWEWTITVAGSEGNVIIHERGTDGEHDFAATYGNGVLVWGQADSNDPAVNSSTAFCCIAFLRGQEGKLKITGTKNVYDTPPADDYASIMTFSGKQPGLKVR